MEDVPHYLCSLVYNWFIRVFLRTQIQDNLSGFTTLAPQVISNTGGSQPHENRQPYMVLNVIIALQGIFPSRN